MRVTRSNRAISTFAVLALLASGATAQSTKHQFCQQVGGMLLTNLGAVDQATTMGPATGDLKGAVGATILLNGIRFTVIGTLQKVGHGDNMNMNLRSFVPFHAMQNYFRPLNAGIATDTVSFINYQPRSRAVHEAAKQEVHKIIARNRGRKSSGGTR